jgi:hypothetical protein
MNVLDRIGNIGFRVAAMILICGCASAMAQASQSEPGEQPDFELRGTVLFLMKDASYDYRLTPEEFPWFYDRELLTRYFDTLHANRFNTLFLWTGHLFPSIVELPEYPDAGDLSREELLANQAQFRWFTDECAKRNIDVLLHFYQIHVTKAFAASRDIPVANREPSDLLRKYVRYSLDRFLAEFKNVGLYVCPGEALQSQYQPEWIRDVIFAAAEASGHHPRIVVRDWSLDAERFRQVCGKAYDNLYTELKHNVEMIVSPVPDAHHAFWKGVARRHIVNLHEIADIKPFRWGSPLFIQEMVKEWKNAGIDGAEVYGMVSWRWPYALDKLDENQAGLWPPGRKLLTFERDWIWLEAVGRYLWKADRDPEVERAYWNGRLAERFGTPKAGDLLRQWYDTTGPVLPGLQNLTSVMNMNYHPTAVGMEQYVDEILAARTAGEASKSAKGLWGSRGYPSRPVDTFFFERYKKRFDQPGLTNRISMPVSVFADRTAGNEPVEGFMTPDRVSLLLVELAREGAFLARKAVEAATRNRDEVERFVSDSEALHLIAQAWRCKVMAAFHKRLWQKTGGDAQADLFLEQLERSVQVYEKLVELTDRTYVNPTDMLMRINWHAGLEHFRRDLHSQTQRCKALLLKTRPGVLWMETEEMDGNWELQSSYSGYFGKGFRVSNGPEQRGTLLTRRIQVTEAGRYAVWAHGLIGPGDCHREFAVSVNDEWLPPTHGEEGPQGGAFVWRRAGEVELSPGSATLAVKDAGPGYECPDVIVLTRDLAWDPLK